MSDLAQVYSNASKSLSLSCTTFCGGSSDYYVDTTQEMIGRRPVYTARSKEYDIPKIFFVNRMNMPDGQFACYGPNWGPYCR